VLCYWRDRVPDALELLKQQAADAHPRVRLEAVRAASFFKEPEAVEGVLISADQPADEYIEFVRGETMRALDPFVKKALSEGKQIRFTSLAGARYFLRSVATADLLKLKRDKAVVLEILTRKGVRDEDRKTAVVDLAKLDNVRGPAALLAAVRLQDEQAAGQDEAILFDLVCMLLERGPQQLQGVRGELEKLATTAKTPVTRQLGYVALIAADGGVEQAWKVGTK